MLIATVIVESVCMLYLSDVNAVYKSKYEDLVKSKKKTDSLLFLKELQEDSIRLKRDTLVIEKAKVERKLDNTVSRIKTYVEIHPTDKDEKEALRWIEQYNSDSSSF